MPKALETPAIARAELVKASKKWRAELELLRKATKGEQEKKTIRCLDEALDATADGVLTALSKVDEVSSIAHHNSDGVKMCQEMVDGYGLEQETQKKELERVGAAADGATLTSNSSARQAKAALNQIQLMQLEAAARGIICRNIKPTTHLQPERYEDMETAFFRAMSVINVKPKVNQVKRLQRVKGDNARFPSTMKVELQSPGERIKLYNAIDLAVSNNIQMEFSVSSEIPRYAINAHRLLGKLAAIIRQQNPDTKTRVAILRGDVWPTIQIKQRNGQKYTKCPDDILQTARAEHLRAQKELSAEKKRKKTAAEANMDTSGN